MTRVQRFSVEEVIASADHSDGGRIATRYVEAAWLGMLFPPICLVIFVYALYSKGLNVVSFFYLFKDPSISPVRPLLGAIAFLAWLLVFPRLALPVMFKSRTAIAFRAGHFDFNGHRFDVSEVDHFERRVHGLLGDVVMVLRDGAEVSVSQSFVRGFPLRHA